MSVLGRSGKVALPRERHESDGIYYARNREVAAGEELGAIELDGEELRDAILAALGAGSTGPQAVPAPRAAPED